MTDDIEWRLREMLRARADAIVVPDRPWVPGRRGWVRVVVPLGVAAAVAAAAVATSTLVPPGAEVGPGAPATHACPTAEPFMFATPEPMDTLPPRSVAVLSGSSVVSYSPLPPPPSTSEATPATGPSGTAASTWVTAPIPAPVSSGADVPESGSVSSTPDWEKADPCAAVLRGFVTMCDEDGQLWAVPEVDGVILEPAGSEGSVTGASHTAGARRPATVWRTPSIRSVPNGPEGWATESPLTCETTTPSRR